MESRTFRNYEIRIEGKLSNDGSDWFEAAVISCDEQAQQTVLIERVTDQGAHRLLVIWLPPYCPELNLMERYWKHLKELACVNKLHNSIEEVVASAEYILSQQNDPASQLRLTFSKNLCTTT